MGATGWINRFVGIPFLTGGRSYDGVDCWGLVQLMYSDLWDITLPDMHGYEAGVACPRELEMFVEAERPKWEQVESGAERVGDVVLLRISGCPCHVGVVVYPGSMLHCEDGVGVVHEAYDHLRWQKRVVGFYRWPQRSSRDD
jgi:cell wall-associated NlpC family hydrolase